MGERVALLGDDRGHRSHQELNALRHQMLAELDVETVWVPSDSAFDIGEYDGVWLVPGSPYADDDAVVRALTVVRERGIPFLGSCGGMQYAVLEFVRSVLGGSATHAESDGEGDDNVVTALACSLYGEERLVTPVLGTRFDGWVDGPFTGMHFCNYAPTADEAGAEVLDFPDHPFYVASMFQPHIGALAGGPVHPLVRAFVAAARHGDSRA